MSDTDLRLLARYTRHQSEEAFAELVRRHLDLVHSAALRQVRSPQLAEEVAQSAFTDLARHASRLAPDTILTAWLYQVTRRTAIDVVRREARRQLREQIATEMNALNASSGTGVSPVWIDIEPHLDEAMSALDDTDRSAVLLRYFENKSLREVGATLGTSDDAAQKRVSRAVERLRAFFAKRGVTVGASGLVVVLSANAVQAAPVGLAVTISTAVALAGTTLAAASTATAAQAIAMTTLQKTLVTVALVAAVGTGIYEARQLEALRTQLRAAPSAPRFAGQMQQLLDAGEDATRQLASLREENDRLSRNTAELMRLRAENGRLRSELADLRTASPSDPVVAEAVSWKYRVSLLKQRLEATAGAKIPELQFLTEQDWLNAARDELKSEKDYRQALGRLRSAGENKFVGELQPALRGYLDANRGQFPTDLTQLQPYFKSPPDPAILERWAIVPAGVVPSLGMGEEWIVTQKAAPDGEFDQRWGVGPNGYGSTGSFDPKPNPVETLTPALQSFHSANKGQAPSDPADLLPYLTTEEQRAELEKFSQRFKTMSAEDRAKMWTETEQFIAKQAAGGK